MGAPSLPPGRYFRMHMIGYFEGIDSERGIVWRCSDSLSLREFLRLAHREKVPDHSWLSKTRSRLPHEVHEKVFEFALKIVAERGLVKGERIGVDGSTMEANAAMRAIVRRDNGATYREMLTRMAKESGVETPTIDDLVRLDRKRKGKKLSNEDWGSKTDPDAKIVKMKDGSTHLAYKLEHAVDLETGVIVAAPLHGADEGDIATLDPTLAAAEKNLAEVGLTPTPEDPCDIVADKGYHSRDVLKDSATAHGRLASPSPGRVKAICVGMATTRLAQRSMRTVTGCDLASARRPCANAARLWSAASRMFWSAAACAARGCVVGKTSTSDTSSMSRATISEF